MSNTNSQKQVITKLQILPSNVTHSIDPTIKLNVSYYKYLSCPEDCENMVNNGEIWFTGANCNRFYQNDPNEYYFQGHTKILSPALSLSILAPGNSIFRDRPCVEIFDLDSFIHVILNVLLNPYPFHQVSWLKKAELLNTLKKKEEEYIRQGRAEEWKALSRGYKPHITSLKTIKDENKIYEQLKIGITSLDARKIGYYMDNPVEPLSMVAQQRAWSLADKFKDEEEIRLELNTSAFLDMNHRNPEPALHNLVEYIKLSCPEIKNFCRIVK